MRFTSKEDAFIEKYAGILGRDEIAAALGKTPQQISYRANKLRDAGRIVASLRATSETVECPECRKERTTLTRDLKCRVCAAKERAESLMDETTAMAKKLGMETQPEPERRELPNFPRESGGRTEYQRRKAHYDYVAKVEQYELNEIEHAIDALAHRKWRWRKKLQDK